MKNVFKLLLACLLVVSAETYAQNNGKQDITGGQAINISTRPFQISLQVNSRHNCGGSIIAPNWIITAAHCVAGRSMSNHRVGAGASNLSDMGRLGQYAAVERAFVHPNYRSLDNDIALLKLRTPLTYNSNVTPVRLIDDRDRNLDDPGNQSYASGWGWQFPGTSSGPNGLRGVSVPIISNTEAHTKMSRVRPSRVPTANMIATDAVSNTRRGPCHGDSGGPLTVRNPRSGLPYLVGLVSWGIGGCGGGANSPTIYAKVYNYRTWVRSIICQNTPGCSTFDAVDYQNPEDLDVVNILDRLSNGGESQELVVAPNPTSGIASIVGLSGNEGTFQVFDSMGKSVRAGNVGNVNTLDIDLGAFPVGVYTVRLTIDGQTQAKRIVKY